MDGIHAPARVKDARDDRGRGEGERFEVRDRQGREAFDAARLPDGHARKEELGLRPPRVRHGGSDGWMRPEPEVPALAVGREALNPRAGCPGLPGDRIKALARAKNAPEPVAVECRLVPARIRGPAEPDGESIGHRRCTVGRGGIRVQRLFLRGCEMQRMEDVHRRRRACRAPRSRMSPTRREPGRPGRRPRRSPCPSRSIDPR